jgi:NADPH:quinone reductase-like Zn-dependent oxidoreductase
LSDDQQVIDYTQHPSLPTYLNTLTSPDSTSPQPQFDSIIDTIYSSPLYTLSPSYLSPTGRFISIVGGRTQGIYPFIMHKLRPVVLGGTPRRWDILGLAPNGELAREVGAWIGEDVLKEVPVDKEFGFEEVGEAFERVASKRSRGKVVVRVE